MYHVWSYSHSVLTLLAYRDDDCLRGGEITGVYRIDQQKIFILAEPGRGSGEDEEDQEEVEEGGSHAGDELNHLGQSHFG